MRATTYSSRSEPFRKLLSALVLVPLAFLVASEPRAVPFTGAFVEDDRCDVIRGVRFTDELVDHVNPQVPVAEQIDVGVFPDTRTTCETPARGSDPTVADWLVSITNLSPIFYINLFFVADTGFTVHNADGTVAGEDAFEIDMGGVPGVNTPLISENGVIPGVFEAGETWEFLVTDYAAMPAFGSIGVPSDGITPNGMLSNASIIACEVPARSVALLVQQPASAQQLVCASCPGGSCPMPEPPAVSLLLVGLMALALAYHRLSSRGFRAQVG